MIGNRGNGPRVIYAKLLLVDSNERRGQELTSFLSRKGYGCDLNASMAQALASVKSDQYDLILTSLYLRDSPSAELCRTLRTYDAGILLSVFMEEEDPADEVAVLNAGADDCIALATGPDVLLARVRALLRRKTRRSTAFDVSFGNLEIDLFYLEAKFGNRRVGFTSTELRLLCVLAQAQGKVVSREELMQKVWRTDGETDLRMVDSHVRNLRKKLKLLSEDCSVVCARGSGYRLMSPGNRVVTG